MEEIECNSCGCIMDYNEENGIYICTNFECSNFDN